MTATFVRNKEIGLAAAWWLYKDATFSTFFFDTTGTTAPALTTPLGGWFNPVDYTVSPAPAGVDLAEDTGGLPAYGATITYRAELPQLELVVGFPNYGGPLTYTHIGEVCMLHSSKQALWQSGDPFEPFMPTVAFIEESPAITLQTTQTKTYKLDLWGDSQT